MKSFLQCWIVLAAVTKIGEMFSGCLGQIFFSLKAHVLAIEVKNPALREWNKVVLHGFNSCWKRVVDYLCTVREQELTVLRDIWTLWLRAGTSSC